MQELVWGGQWEILHFRAIKFGGDVVEFTTSIRITSGCLSISPHKIIWLFLDNFLVSLTKKCITDDLLLTFVNKIWVQPFELVFEIHNQLPDSGQNGLDNNLQMTFSNKFSSVGVAISGLSESKTMLDPIKHSILMAVGIPMKVKAVIIKKHAVAAFVTKTVVDTYCDQIGVVMLSIKMFKSIWKCIWLKTIL